MKPLMGWKGETWRIYREDAMGYMEEYEGLREIETVRK